MKIIMESDEEQQIPTTSDNIKTSKRGIANAFDIKRLRKEIEKYNVITEILPQRQWDDTLYAMYIRAPYQGVNNSLENETKDAAVVALIVDYSDMSALAMARSGSDKEVMMLISSIANKYINKPFKYNTDIRSRI